MEGGMVKLSIVMPVYNEKGTLNKILKKVEKVNLGKIKKEIILIDDFSTDGTREILKKLKGYKILYHKKNQGKGAAIRTGFKNITGDIVIIQDADLEYDPGDYKKLIKPILDKKTEVVYGSRFIKKGFKPAHKIFYLGNLFLSFVTRLLYSQKITDMETCYKVFTKKAIDEIKITANGFELEPELTAKLIKKGHKIIEIPVSYTGRTIDEGKKLRPVKDGLKAFWYLVKYKFTG